MRGSFRLGLGAGMVVLGAFGLLVFPENNTLGGISSVTLIAGILTGCLGWDARVESRKKRKSNPVETSKKLELKRERKVQ